MAVFVFQQAQTPEFRSYQESVLKNARSLAYYLMAKGLSLFGTLAEPVALNLGPRHSVKHCSDSPPPRSVIKFSPLCRLHPTTRVIRDCHEIKDCHQRIS
jgi:hypothetical protein